MEPCSEKKYNKLAVNIPTLYNFRKAFISILNKQAI